MNKVIFYKVALFHRGVENYLDYPNDVSRPDRATIGKLFECYCVNQDQIDKIKGYLQRSLTFEETHGNIFRYSIGFQKLGTSQEETQ